MHIFKCLYLLKEINNLLLTYLVANIICFQYWFRIVAKHSLSSESITIILFKTSHLRVHLWRNYFGGLAETHAVRDFQRSCVCTYNATFMTWAAHLWQHTST